MTEYRHTQIATITIALTVLASLAALVRYIVRGREAANLRDIVVPLVPAVLFGVLTTEVRGGRIRVAFGPGGFAGRWFDADNVVEARRSRIPWFLGTGLRWLPGTWIANASPGAAIDLRFANGRRLRVGTDDPDGLLAAVRSAMR